ncbi:MAG: hypothetical protein AVDCRST_MAG01-01-509, partial [uncultured Rubrobacteraceae bacterium]
ERRNARAAGQRELLLERRQLDHGGRRQEPQGPPSYPSQPGHTPFPGARHDRPGVRRRRRLLRAGSGGPGRRRAGV